MLWWQATPTKKAPPPGSQQRKSRCPPRNHNNHHGWDNKTDAIDVSEDHSPQDEIALHYIQPNVTVRNTHPEEIMVRYVCAPQCNEAYTTIQCQPCSASRLIPELEATCYPSMFFNTFTHIRSVQLACPLPWTMSVPDSLPTMDPIYLCMVHSMDPSPGSQITLELDPAR